MRTNVIAFTSVLLLVLTGCSSGGPAADDTQAAAMEANAADRTLTLQDIYLGHADSRTWEPGDPLYSFPEAGVIDYGYRRLTRVHVELDRRCERFAVERRVGVDERSTRFDVSCVTSRDGSRLVARSDYTYVDSEAPSLKLGSRLVFEPGITLTKLGADHYRVDLP